MYSVYTLLELFSLLVLPACGLIYFLPVAAIKPFVLVNNSITLRCFLLSNM